MDTIKLSASKREIAGKKVRFLRRQGITPVHLFGHNVDSQSLQCDAAELQKAVKQAGMSRPISLKVEGQKEANSVFIKEIQRNQFKNTLIHVDFYQVHKDEKMRMDVPIVLTGEAPAIKIKGRFITHNINTVEIEGLPDDLPSQIEVDISPLEEPDQAIYVRDIKLGKGLVLHADADQIIVKVSETALKAAEEQAEAETEVAIVGAPEEPEAEAEG